MEICRDCKTEIILRRVPFGKRAIEVKACECLALKLTLKYQNTNTEKTA